MTDTLPAWFAITAPIVLWSAVLFLKWRDSRSG